jgi:hypothetical protein
VSSLTQKPRLTLLEGWLAQFKLDEIAVEALNWGGQNAKQFCL